MGREAELPLVHAASGEAFEVASLWPALAAPFLCQRAVTEPQAVLGGAVLGSALVYVIPAAMGVASKLQKGKKTPLTTGEKAEVVACGAMGVTGVALGVLGAIMSLKGAAH